ESGWPAATAAARSLSKSTRDALNPGVAMLAMLLAVTFWRRDTPASAFSVVAVTASVKIDMHPPKTKKEEQAWARSSLNVNLPCCCRRLRGGRLSLPWQPWSHPVGCRLTRCEEFAPTCSRSTGPAPPPRSHGRQSAVLAPDLSDPSGTLTPPRRDPPCTRHLGRCVLPSVNRNARHTCMSCRGASLTAVARHPSHYERLGGPGREYIACTRLVGSMVSWRARTPSMKTWAARPVTTVVARLPV